MFPILALVPESAQKSHWHQRGDLPGSSPAVDPRGAVRGLGLKHWRGGASTRRDWASATAWWIMDCGDDPAAGFSPLRAYRFMKSSMPSPIRGIRLFTGGAAAAAVSSGRASFSDVSVAAGGQQQPPNPLQEHSLPPKVLPPEGQQQPPCPPVAEPVGAPVPLCQS